MDEMLKEMLTAIANHMVGILVAIISVIVARYLKKGFELVEDKLSIEIDDKAEAYVLHIVRKAIRHTWQTYVKEKKKKGKFGKKEKKEAVGRAVTMIGNEARRSGFGDYIDSREILSDIESELVKVKNDSRRK